LNRRQFRELWADEGIYFVIFAVILIVLMGLVMWSYREYEHRRIACEAHGGMLITRDWVCVRKDALL
jgi:uncharacterized iron-regulated membrane protein